MPLALLQQAANIEEATDSSNRDPVVTPLAKAIIGAGMREPAILALQIIRPLSWVGAQFAWVAQPFFEGLGMGRRSGQAPNRSPFSIAGIANFLEGEGNIEGLINTLGSTADHPERHGSK